MLSDIQTTEHLMDIFDLLNFDSLKRFYNSVAFQMIDCWYLFF